jgi:hypothetical protein
VDGSTSQWRLEQSIARSGNAETGDVGREIEESDHRAGTAGGRSGNAKADASRQTGARARLRTANMIFCNGAAPNKKDRKAANIQK